MRNKLLTFSLLCGIFYSSNAIQITPTSEFSILTNTPGNELYTIFGHCALRYKDTSQNIDIVYNYGTFNFQTPNFYLKFVKGKLNYFLSIERYPQYIWGLHSMQTAYEQVLNLSDKQKKDLAKFLSINYLPENRYYLYDFFYDNCATRLRDVLSNAMPGEINYEFFQPEEEKSFRQLLDPYIKHIPWVHLGIDLIMGLSGDDVANPLDYFFLPEYVMEAFAVSTINTNESLIAKTNLISEGNPPVNELKIFSNPNFVFWLLFVIILITSIQSIRKKRIRFWIDRLTFGIVGILGLFLLVLWLITDHNALQQNLNIIWAIPIHFVIIFVLSSKMLAPFLKIYFLINFILEGLLFLSWSFLPQEFNLAVMPIILILAVRSLRLNLYYKSLR